MAHSNALTRFVAPIRKSIHLRKIDALGLARTVKALPNSWSTEFRWLRQQKYEVKKCGKGNKWRMRRGGVRTRKQAHKGQQCMHWCQSENIYLHLRPYILTKVPFYWQHHLLFIRGKCLSGQCARHAPSARIFTATKQNKQIGFRCNEGNKDSAVHRCKTLIDTRSRRQVRHRPVVTISRGETAPPPSRRASWK